MKRIATSLMILFLLCVILPAGAASPLQDAQQAGLDQFVSALAELEIPLGTQEIEIEEDAGTREAAIINVLPDSKLWITYWEGGATDIQLVVMADTTTEAQRKQIFTAFLEAFAKVADNEEAQAAYSELEAAFPKEPRGFYLEKEGYGLMLSLHEGEYMLSVFYP